MKDALKYFFKEIMRGWLYSTKLLPCKIVNLWVQDIPIHIYLDNIKLVLTERCKSLSFSWVKYVITIYCFVFKKRNTSFQQKQWFYSEWVSTLNYSVLLLVFFLVAFTAFCALTFYFFKTSIRSNSPQVLFNAMNMLYMHFAIRNTAPKTAKIAFSFMMCNLSISLQDESWHNQKLSYTW